MKISKKLLKQIVKEEFYRYLSEIYEAEEPKKKGKKSDVVDATADQKNEPKDPKAATGKDKPRDEKIPKPKKPESLPISADPADGDLEKDVEDPTAGTEKDGEEDAEDVTGGKIADELTGKTVQSITMEPKSKLLPGAQEIVLTFKETPDPLKILVTKQGQVKFHFRGLHNQV